MFQSSGKYFRKETFYGGSTRKDYFKTVILCACFYILNFNVMFWSYSLKRVKYNKLLILENLHVIICIIIYLPPSLESLTVFVYGTVFRNLVSKVRSYPSIILFFYVCALIIGILKSWLVKLLALRLSKIWVVLNIKDNQGMFVIVELNLLVPNSLVNSSLPCIVSTYMMKTVKCMLNKW